MTQRGLREANIEGSLVVMHRLKAHEVPSAAAPKVSDSISHPKATAQTGEFAINTAHARIAVAQTASDGLPFLFLHGNSASKDVFGHQFNGPLGRANRLLAMDLPGHGQSGDAFEPSATYSIEGYADAAVEVLEALNVEQVVIIGWSLGGHVALEMMARFPGVVGAMLIGTPPLGHGMDALMAAYRPDERASLLAKAELSDGEALQLAQAVVGPDLAPLAETAIKRTDSNARPLMFASLMRGAFEDERDLVAQSETPIAVVAGAEDPFVNTGYLASIAYANLWAGVCHLLPGAGHAPFLTSPDLFDPLLTRFVHEMHVRARKLKDSPPLAYSG